MNRADIYVLIDAERAQQEQKWSGLHRWGEGSCASPRLPTPVKVAVLTEETGEVARAVLESDHQGLITELVQTAAVAVAWLEGLPE